MMAEHLSLLWHCMTGAAVGQDVGGGAWAARGGEAGTLQGLQDRAPLVSPHPARLKGSGRGSRPSYYVCTGCTDESCCVVVSG